MTAGVLLMPLTGLNANFTLREDFICALTQADGETMLYITQEEQTWECREVCQAIAPAFNSTPVRCFFQGKELSLAER
ncbi:MAG: hypothetical protein HC920_19900 [Oscillatoriales cyanobacterium SM2_3_0]|nr:hypothetical protein [Oscillatoriales cyanobacterium SM2_3_0]